MVRQFYRLPRWRRFMAWVCSGLVVALVLTGTGWGMPGQTLDAPGSRAQVLVEQGVQAYRAGDYGLAIARWVEQLNQLPTSPSQERAILFENLARSHQQLGLTVKAVADWQRALEEYRRLGDRWKTDSEQARILVEQAQAYSRLGQHRRSLGLLCGEKFSGVEGGEVEFRGVAQGCRRESAVGLTRGSLSAQGGRLQSQDAGTAIAALGALGETYRLLGQHRWAQEWLKQAREVASATGDSTYELALLVSEGSLADSLARLNGRRAEAVRQMGDEETELFRQPWERAKLENEKARKAFEQALGLAQQTQDSVQQVGLLLRLMGVYAREGELEKVQEMRRLAQALLLRLPDSQAKVFGLIDWVQGLDVEARQLGESLGGQSRCVPEWARSEASLRSLAKPIAMLEQGLRAAQMLGDARTLSFVQGEMGHWAECQQDWPRALGWTQAAIATVQADPQGLDSLYLWLGQLGRILAAQGQREGAIAAYQQAVATLEGIRGDMLATDPEVQFDFRDTIEPIYRELVALQLQEFSPDANPVRASIPRPLADTKTNAKTNAKTPDSNPIRPVLQTIDSLKLAELQNYFGSDCALVQSKTVIDLQAGSSQAGSSQTAVINTVIFPKRTAVIATFPDGRFQVAWLNQDQVSLQAMVNEFRRGLESYFREFDSSLAQGLYDGLIRPFEAQLQANQIKTLVFVNDGILRTVPMAALHDGRGFLIERFAVAVTPSLQLTDPQPLRQGALSALALGLTEAVTLGTERFEALPNVAQELESVARQVPGTQRLLDRDFSRARLERMLAQRHFPILHIATHGKFGAEPERNFIVTGDHDKITIRDLDGLIRRAAPVTEPIELLALTACETAIGDERATLGLAGVALRAGARSAVASLWSINDAATAEVVRGFYGGVMRPGVNKAEALQVAQVGLIRQGGELAHPARWAPLVLIGNWL